MRSLAKAPVAHFQMIRSDLEGRPSSSKSAMAKEEAQRLTMKYEGDLGNGHDQIAIKLGNDRRTPREFWRAGAGYTLTLPTKLLSVPIIDGLGSSAWETLIRRSRVIFHTDEEMSVSRVRFRALDPKHPGELVPLGGGSMLFRTLQDFTDDEKKNGRQWEITIVAHSMGAIVANEIIRNFPELPITNVVYMAAATSLRDYEDTVFPWLRRNNCVGKVCSDRVKMYHLTLHRAAEVRDTVAKSAIGIFDLAPRGPLLVWIDNYLSRPNIPLDRTAGRFVNLMTEVHNVPKELYPAIHIREFDVGRDAAQFHPQKHGDFGSIRFWDERCWKPETEYDGYCYDAKQGRGGDPGVGKATTAK